MPEGLKTADGAPIEGVAPVGDEQAAADFDAMMAAQAAAADAEPEREAPAPPRKDAPYGYTVDADGTQRPKKAAGRPRKDRAGQPRVEAPKGKDRPRRDYTRDLTGFVQTLWGACAAFAPADAGAVSLHGPGMVKAWNDLAQEDARVARAVEWLTTGSTYGAVVMTTAPLIMQVMTNHGVLPHERVKALGVLDPAELAELTGQQLAAMQQQAG